MGFDAAAKASGGALTHAGLLVGIRVPGVWVPICMRRDGEQHGARVPGEGIEIVRRALTLGTESFDAGQASSLTIHRVLGPHYWRCRRSTPSPSAFMPSDAAQNHRSRWPVDDVGFQAYMVNTVAYRL